jgi:hypothetical protein
VPDLKVPTMKKSGRRVEASTLLGRDRVFFSCRALKLLLLTAEPWRCADRHGRNRRSKCPASNLEVATAWPVEGGITVRAMLRWSGASTRPHRRVAHHLHHLADQLAVEDPHCRDQEGQSY